MIYSRYRPHGGYDYFETKGNAALGDDLPTPNLSPINGVGAPSVNIGRRMPGDAKWVGSGDRALGVITAMDPAKVKASLQLSGDAEKSQRLLLWTAVFATAAYVGLKLRVHQWRAA